MRQIRRGPILEACTELLSIAHEMAEIRGSEYGEGAGGNIEEIAALIRSDFGKMADRVYSQAIDILGEIAPWSTEVAS